MSAPFLVPQIQDFLTEIFFKKNLRIEKLRTHVVDLMFQTVPCFYAETLVLRPCQ